MVYHDVFSLTKKMDRNYVMLVAAGQGLFGYPDVSRMASTCTAMRQDMEETLDKGAQLRELFIQWVAEAHPFCPAMVDSSSSGPAGSDSDDSSSEIDDLLERLRQREEQWHAEDAVERLPSLHDFQLVD